MIHSTRLTSVELTASNLKKLHDLSALSGVIGSLSLPNSDIHRSLAQPRQSWRYPLAIQPRQVPGWED